MDINLLSKTANAMVASGKGILAIDESHSTCKKRFDAYNIECSEESRRAYRELLITAPGAEKFLSGMILFDETMRQKTADGTPFPEALKKRGMIPGIKVDKGAMDLALHPGEKVTEGLDSLRERLVEYRTLGAQFAKWRAVITIAKNCPSEACIHANAHALARYASLCQEQDIVPMVEPEILIDGDHTMERCYEVTEWMLKTLFKELAGQGVAPEGTILKVSMVLPGKDCQKQANVEEVAKQTVRCLTTNVPKNLAGIVFLSGGQSDEKATAHLNAMNKSHPPDADTSVARSAERHCALAEPGFGMSGAAGVKLPWPLSFSYGRAIQNAALQIWAKNRNDVERAQGAVVTRSQLNSLAAQGKYDAALEH